MYRYCFLISTFRLEIHDIQHADTKFVLLDPSLITHCHFLTQQQDGSQLIELLGLRSHHKNLKVFVNGFYKVVAWYAITFKMFKLRIRAP